MMKKLFQLLCTLYLVLCASAQAMAQDATVPNGPQKAPRYASLLSAKDLLLTTQNNKKHYYLVSSNDKLMLHLDGDDIRIGADTYAKSDVKTMRFRSMPRLLLDEDSTSHGEDYAVDHGLLALRRSFRLGGWNTLVLPVNLTGAQVCELFGEDTKLAFLRGGEIDDEISVEFDLIDLQTEDVALTANVCYLIRPTREPDVAANKTVSNLADTRVKGPIYMLPNVSMETEQKTKISYVRDEQNNITVRFRGTYIRLDNTVMRTKTAIANKMLTAGTWSFNDEGYIVENTDSTLLQAFRCWFQNLDETKKLRFYINGVEDNLNGDATGISILKDLKEPDDHNVYDLSGRRVTQPTKGLYIVNGKKVYIK